jgi:hypothetical protein
MYPASNFQQSARVLSGATSTGSPLVSGTRGRSSDRRDAGGDVDSRPAGFAAKVAGQREERR